MSLHINSNGDDDLVFFVDEEGSDFTFYLSRDAGNSVVGKLIQTRQRDRRGLRFATIPGDEFSFGEKVAVKRLGKVKDGFWKNLQKPRRKSQYDYLLQRLHQHADAKSQSRIKPEERKGKLAKALLRRLKSGGSLSKDDKSELQTFLAGTLNEGIHQDDLESQPWFGSIFARLKKPQRDFVASLVDSKQKQFHQNLMVIEKAFFPALERKLEEGRALICLSHNGKYLSVTFRKLKSGSGYEAKPYGPKPREQAARKKYLFSIGEYCSQIYDEVFVKTKSAPRAQGLLVVTGPTNSAKSEIARGLIYKYLTDKSQTTRRPHLVTFEDPIEESYVHETMTGHPFVAVNLKAKSLGIDYTSRQKGRDVGTLEKALEDALRQTPAVFFVAETRDKEEWELLLDFAATGHLIVTTAHAGSLVEAMHKIFEARRVKTPADRSEIANKLLAIIHLRNETIVINVNKKREDTTNALFPALWRRTPRGVAALTSDGLASLLPHRPNQNENDDPPSCVGRRWFIEQLIMHAKGSHDKNYLEMVFRKNLNQEFGKDKKSESMRRQAYRKAAACDLEGV